MPDHTLHPDVATLVEGQEHPSPSQLSVKGVRELAQRFVADVTNPTHLSSVEEYVILGHESDVRVRVYSPTETVRGRIVYFHGGGWVSGGLDTHHAICTRLCDTSDFEVVSVAYHRSPEHSFPHPLEDCYAATQWAATTATDDTRPLVVAGDSAGGNLAAAVALLCRDRDGPDVAHQVLAYPMLAYDDSYRSYRENAENGLLSSADVEWFWDQYIDRAVDRRNPYAVPIRTQRLEGLPRATILTCEFDPLRDEGASYANRLDEDGVAVQHHHYDRMPHGFLELVADPGLDTATEAIAQIASDLPGRNRGRQQSDAADETAEEHR